MDCNSNGTAIVTCKYINVRNHKYLKGSIIPADDVKAIKKHYFGSGISMITSTGYCDIDNGRLSMNDDPINFSWIR